MHLVDRKHSGAADGFLGYDYLSSYESIINIRNMTIEFNIANHNNEKFEKHENKNNVQNQDAYQGKNTNKHTNGSKKMAIDNDTPKRAPNNYDFESKTPKCGREETKIESKKTEKHEFENYYNAAKFYKIEIQKRIESKVNPENYLKIRPIYSLRNSRTDMAGRGKLIYEKLNLENCNVDEKNFIKQICQKFPYQFFIEGDTLGSTHIIKHNIRLKPDAPIINVRQYRIPQTHRKVLHHNRLRKTGHHRKMHVTV